MTLIEALNIPNRCLVNQKIPKKLYYENVQMNAVQKRYFKEELESLMFSYNLAPDIINIPAFSDEDYIYDHIAVIEAELRSPKHAQAIAETLHKVPYPVVLVLTHQKHTMLSLAPKRINRADNSKRTIEEYVNTEWFDMEQLKEVQKNFLESLNISHLSYEHLYKLYADIISRITALQSACITDRFSIADDTEHQRELLSAIEKLQLQINELRSQLKKESQFNEKVQLNMELKKLEQMVVEKQQALKEI